VALIEWSNKLSVNVAEIDEQHQMLVAMTNELNDAMCGRNSHNEALMIIVKMTDYAKVHFRTEEKYFDQFDYPESASHKKEHNDFKKKVKQLENDFVDGSLSLPTDVLNFLKEWLVKHIQGSDKRYSTCFNENGLK